MPDFDIEDLEPGKETETSDKLIRYEFNKFYYEEIIKLFINVFKKTIIIEDFKVSSVYSLRDRAVHSPRIFETKEGLLDSYDIEIFSDFTYKDIPYTVRFFDGKDRESCMHYNLNFSYRKNVVPDERIGHKLLALAFSHTSTYKKGCMNISFYGSRQAVSLITIDHVTPVQSSMENVFVRSDIKEDIERFIYAFKNYKEFNFPLRFLLSGKPGLGKTEIIRAIISECSKHGNVIIPEHMNGADWLTFEFAKLFTPALVCIDDIDLIFGTRQSNMKKQSLGEFLTLLDGIQQNKFFLIATTNDKNLVDIAASRPGRFDEIIDFGDFERKYYSRLIKQRTDKEIIINLFDDEILDLMEDKKVTGAFIVNLIKQLEVLTKINSLFSKKNLIEYLNRSYKGFYKSQVEIDKSFGF